MNVTILLVIKEIDRRLVNTFATATLNKSSDSDLMPFSFLEAKQIYFLLKKLHSIQIYVHVVFTVRTLGPWTLDIFFEHFFSHYRVWARPFDKSIYVFTLTKCYTRNVIHQKKSLCSWSSKKIYTQKCQVFTVRVSLL